MPQVSKSGTGRKYSLVFCTKLEPLNLISKRCLRTRLPFVLGFIITCTGGILQREDVFKAMEFVSFAPLLDISESSQTQFSQVTKLIAGSPSKASRGSNANDPDRRLGRLRREYKHLLVCPLDRQDVLDANDVYLANMAKCDESFPRSRCN
jgi:hypothetical protein